MHTIEETVTPAQAEIWLRTQAPNRTPIRSHVNYLATEIRAGRWRVTHQGIAFDNHGVLLDGQHRLMAIVAAGLPVRVLVTRGLSREDALAGVDVGKNRSRAQLLAMQGVSNSTVKAAICRAIAVMTTPDLPYTQSLGPLADQEIFARYRNKIESVLERGGTGRKLPSQFLAVVTLVDDVIPAFLDGVATGENLTAGDPRLSLREFLYRSKGSKVGGGSNLEVLLRSINAADAFAHGERLTKTAVSVARYRRFCTDNRLQPNSSLLALADGWNGR